ncbi:integrator complex subunit 12-like [Clavelina lepadiformis]|uniref:integrator complex subunit 12-like n=1 Tax=Clavelina lepadiformis TaxID=159417 RepID=UPI00404269C9
MAAQIELDPILMKALGIFHSRSQDAAEKLKKMLDDNVENSKRPHSSRDVEKSNLILKAGKQLPKLIPKPLSSNAEQRKKDKESVVKRQYDKLHKELEELNHDAKKPHLDSPSPTSGLSSSTSGGSQPSSKHGSPAHDLVFTNGAYGKVSPQTTLSANEFELEMEGLACAICKDMSVGTGNQLAECQECHNLYHQECHQPQISDQDINDPRCIWYCTRCKRNMKKQAKQNFVKSPHITLASSIDLFRDKPTDLKSKNSIMPFKRTEIKATVTSANNGAGSMSGWAVLSGKPITGFQKTADEQLPKLLQVKHETSIPGPKDKSKVLKNHLKTSDAWAEALCASKAPADKPKSTSHKANVVNNSAKHLSLSNSSWLSTPGSNIPSKPKSTSLPNSASNKTAPFPKASATTGKKSTTQETAEKKLQMVKKKADAKMLQKRTRV